MTVIAIEHRIPGSLVLFGGVGVVGCAFAGRPNVVADAAGVLRTGNTAVMRIGIDALGTTRAVMRQTPASALAGPAFRPGPCRYRAARTVSRTYRRVGDSPGFNWGSPPSGPPRET